MSSSSMFSQQQSHQVIAKQLVDSLLGLENASLNCINMVLQKTPSVNVNFENAQFFEGDRHSPSSVRPGG